MAWPPGPAKTASSWGTLDQLTPSTEVHTAAEESFVGNLFLCHTDQLAGSRALVRDRGSQFIKPFDETFRTEDFKILKSPVRTPVANAFAERWIGSIRRELLDRTIIWNPRQLERVVVDYIEHHNSHRPHRSLEQRPPLTTPDAEPGPPRLRIVKTTRCDGLINKYRNAA